jgi:hypothetical protein
MDETLDAVFRAGRAAWPSIALDAATFAAHFALHAIFCDDSALANAADLYLACACNVPEAARVDPRPAFVDEVLQALRVRLLVGETPKIATYAGRAGPRCVAGWPPWRSARHSTSGGIRGAIARRRLNRRSALASCVARS